MTSLKEPRSAGEAPRRTVQASARRAPDFFLRHGRGRSPPSLSVLTRGRATRAVGTDGIYALTLRHERATPSRGAYARPTRMSPSALPRSSSSSRRSRPIACSAAVRDEMGHRPRRFMEPLLAHGVGDPNLMASLAINWWVDAYSRLWQFELDEGEWASSRRRLPSRRRATRGFKDQDWSKQFPLRPT